MCNVSGVFLKCDKVPCLILYFEYKNDVKLFFIYSSSQGNSVLNSFSDSELSIFDKTGLKKKVDLLPSDNSINMLGVLSGTSAKIAMTLVWDALEDAPNLKEKVVLN